jgi:hypothetical protein
MARLWYGTTFAPLQDKDARGQGKDNKAREPLPLGCGIVVQEISYAKLV